METAGKRERCPASQPGRRNPGTARAGQARNKGGACPARAARGATRPAGSRGEAQCGGVIVMQPCKNRNKMQLKYSSPEPAPAIVLPVTAVVDVVSIFPFRSLASVGTGTEAEPSGMRGRQCCARLVMGYISSDKMILPDTLPV